MMPIMICEYCGKPYNNVASKLCAACTKEIEEVYIKARRYIYKNSKACDFVAVVEATEIPEKALSYLINKGRILIADRTAGGQRCRACGKETESGTLCQQCMGKILKEQLSAQQNKAGGDKRDGAQSSPASRKVIPMSDKE